MEDTAHTVLGALFVSSCIIMGIVMYLLRGGVRYQRKWEDGFKDWKNDFSNLVSNRLQRHESLISTHKADVDKEFEIFKTWYLRELGKLEDKFSQMHVDCRKEILSDLKRINGAAQIDSKDIVRIDGDIRSLTERTKLLEAIFGKIENINVRIDEIEEAMD